MSSLAGGLNLVSRDRFFEKQRSGIKKRIIFFML